MNVRPPTPGATHWAEFDDDGPVVDMTGLSNDQAIDAVRAEIRKGRRLKNTIHWITTAKAEPPT